MLLTQLWRFANICTNSMLMLSSQEYSVMLKLSEL